MWNDVASVQFPWKCVDVHGRPRCWSTPNPRRRGQPSRWSRLQRGISSDGRGSGRYAGSEGLRRGACSVITRARVNMVSREDSTEHEPDPRRIRTPQDLKQELGLLRIRTARRTGNPELTSSQLAAKLGISTSGANNYLNGRVPPDPMMFDGLVRALGAEGPELGHWAEAWQRLRAEPPKPYEPEPEPEPKSRRKAAMWLGGGGVAVLIAAIVLVISLTGEQGSNGNPNEGDTTGQTQAPGPAGQGDPLVFDGLGGGNSIIRVYPGVSDLATDKVANGTFNSGDTATALCKAKGRSVSSDPKVGEQPRTSDMWIRIVGSPGVRQYATAVYVKDSDALLGKLPAC